MINQFILQSVECEKVCFFEPLLTLGITNRMGQCFIADSRIHSSWKQKSDYQLL